MLTRPSAGTVLSLAVIGLTVACAVIQLDPYIVLGITPFFLLGCAKGKKPLNLVALASLPSLFLIFLSVVKVQLTGLPLSILDRFLIDSNIFVLAYNDYRVAIAMAVIACGIVYYFWNLLSGRGKFSRFEKVGAGVLVAFWAFFAVKLTTSDLDFLLTEENHEPTVRTFVKSMIVPGARLALADADEDDLHLSLRPLGAPEDGKPDLYFVLQESTFDPRLVEPEYEPQTLFSRHLPLSGPLKVHTFGGGTWLSEFSLVTQMRPQEFGDGGWYVFHQLPGRIKRSLFTQLKELGYRTIVIYPVPGFFLNARQFYKSIGVDEFEDPPSLGLGQGWDWKTPDAKFYEAALRKVDETPSQPVAVFLLTIYQHGPHDLERPFADYLSRFKASDTAYGNFLTALKARKKRAGVVAFGDHQPEFTKYLFPDEAARQLTHYEIRCINFKCVGEPKKRIGDEQLDITRLAPTALEHFGFEMDDLSSYGKRLFEHCTADIMRCADSLRLKFNRAFAASFQ
jgi:hypothetical protein